MDIKGLGPVATPTLHHVPKWDKLSASDEVEVYRKGQALAAGRVDVLTPDVVWLFQDHGCGRVLFHRSDGVDIFKRAT